METEVTVRDVITPDFVGVSESDSVRGAVSVMRSEAVSTAVVLRGTDAVGVLTPQDVFGSVANGSDLDETTVGDVMTRNIPTVSPDNSVVDAIMSMSTYDTEWLIVTNGDGVVGVLTDHDVVTASPNLIERQAVDQPTVGGDIVEDRETTDQYSTQSVCENCGSLTRELQNINGQLICDDCRDF